jgi:hypothetical protein
MDFHVPVNQVLSLQFVCTNSSSVVGSHVWSERCCVNSFQNFLASRCSEDGEWAFLGFLFVAEEVVLLLLVATDLGCIWVCSFDHAWLNPCILCGE